MGFKGCNPELVPFTRGVLVSVGGVHGLQSWAGTLDGEGVWDLVGFKGCNPEPSPFMEGVLVCFGLVQGVQSWAGTLDCEGVCGI